MGLLPSNFLNGNYEHHRQNPFDFVNKIQRAKHIGNFAYMQGNCCRSARKIGHIAAS